MGSYVLEQAISASNRPPASNEDWSRQRDTRCVMNNTYDAVLTASQLYGQVAGHQVIPEQRLRSVEERHFGQQLLKLHEELQAEKFRDVDASSTLRNSHMYCGAPLQLEGGWPQQIGRRHENEMTSFRMQQQQPHLDSMGAIASKRGDCESISQNLGQAHLPQFLQAELDACENNMPDMVKDPFLQPPASGLSAGRLDSDLNATSLMVRNIPIQYTQDMLLKEWPNNGDYDFLYLPIHIKKRCNNSFCFINFVTPQAAHAFARKWQHNRLQFYSSRKPLDISLASIQGRPQNLLHFRCSKTMRLNNKNFQPVVFEGTKRIDVRVLLQAMMTQIEQERVMTKIEQERHQTLATSPHPQLCEGMWISV